MANFRTVRYGRAWLTSPADVVEDEIVLERGGAVVPATLAHPRGSREPLPAWVVLHGITRRGRVHGQLARFTRALVSTGAVAIVPEVPEWRALSLAPHLAAPTVRAAVAGLRSSGLARDSGVGLIGFSFGAPHAIAASAHPDLADEVAGSVAFGGYCSLERTVRFLMTGSHEWEGRTHHRAPDPYGRWIVAANYLTHVPEHERAADVAEALLALASEAGDLGVPSADPRLDARKAELRAAVAEEHRGLFDLLAPPAGTPPEARGGARLAEGLAAAARHADPSVEPCATLALVERPVHILHARHDDLIPFSEGLRLHASLASTTRSRVTITRLFGHSGQSALSSLDALRELPAFLSALRRVLRLV